MTERDNPRLWEKVKEETLKNNVMGTKAGQWSARKAQLAVKLYKEAGGGYLTSKSKNNSLEKWTRQQWQTKSGKPSHITGERYLPLKAIESLTKNEYEQTSKAKQKGMNEGKQYVAQPPKIREKVKQYRK